MPHLFTLTKKAESILEPLREYDSLIHDYDEYTVHRIDDYKSDIELLLHAGWFLQYGEPLSVNNIAHQAESGILVYDIFKRWLHNDVYKTISQIYTDIREHGLDDYITLSDNVKYEIGKRQRQLEPHAQHRLMVDRYSNFSLCVSVFRENYPACVVINLNNGSRPFTTDLQFENETRNNNYLTEFLFEHKATHSFYEGVTLPESTTNFDISAPDLVSPLANDDAEYQIWRNLDGMGLIIASRNNIYQGDNAMRKLRKSGYGVKSHELEQLYCNLSHN